MEAKNLELQKKFDLFQIGDVISGMAQKKEKEKIWVKCVGGAWGYIPKSTMLEYQRTGVNIKQEQEYQFLVDNIDEGIPVLELPLSEMLKNSLMKGKVKISTSHKVVISLYIDNKEYYGIYTIKPEDASILPLKEETNILCKNMEMSTSDDVFIVKEIQPLINPENKSDQNAIQDKPEKKEQVFSMPQSWTQEQVLAAAKDGIISIGAMKIGEYYIVTVGKNGRFFFEDGRYALQDETDDFSQNLWEGDTYLAVVSFISEYKKIYIKLIQQVDKSYIEQFNKLQNVDYRPIFCSRKTNFVCIKHGCFFGVRNEEVVSAAKAQNSLNCFERYWLGFCYEADVTKGQIFLQKNDNTEFPATIKNKPKYFSKANYAIFEVVNIQATENGTMVEVDVKYCDNIEK